MAFPPAMRGSLMLIAALALAVRLFALCAIPYARDAGDPNFAPDEQGHLIVVQALAHGQLLRWPEETWTIYSVFPPSQDAAQAAMLRISEQLGLRDRFASFAPMHEEGRGYLWARLGSAIASTLVCLLLALTVARVARDARAGLLAGLACALHPQLAFLGAYVNSDAVTICAGAALTLALARWKDLGESGRGLLAIGAACGGVLITKASGFFLLVPTALWIAWALIEKRVRARELLAPIAILLVVAVPPLALNAHKLGGDPLGLDAYARYLATVWKPKTWPQIPDALLQLVRLMPASVYGLFGNMSLRLPIWHYALFALLFLIGVACAIRLALRARDGARRELLWVIGAVVANLLLELHHLWFVDFQPQGRYILLSSLLVLCAALVAAPRVHEKLRAIPALMIAMLATSTITMEWLLLSRGR